MKGPLRRRRSRALVPTRLELDLAGLIVGLGALCCVVGGLEIGLGLVGLLAFVVLFD